MRYPSTFGKRLKAARYMAELDTDWMGNLLDLHKGSYAKYEADDALPNAAQIVTI